jgi:integrase
MQHLGHTMRQPQPFYRKQTQSWYVQIKGRQHSLGKDKDAALQEYYRLMAGEAPVTCKTPAVQVIDQFLLWTQQNRAPATYDWYFHHCQGFAKFIGAKLTVADIKANHVTRWLEKSYQAAGPTHQNGACRAVSRAFNWARKQGLIQSNPIAGMERPAAEPREAYLKPEEWEKLIRSIRPDDPFADLLWFLRETGCRPHEARIVEARHWDKANRRLVLERKNSKGKKRRRVIRLNERATEIVTRLALKRPEGELFRNKIGKPWAKGTVICRFSKLRKKLGFALFPYILRHTWCTDALLRGVDPLTVAIFLGHTDASMVMKVYSHLVQQDEFLSQKLKQATGEVA